MPKGTPNNTEAAETSVDDLLAGLKPKPKAEPTREEQDKEARILAVEGHVAALGEALKEIVYAPTQGEELIEAKPHLVKAISYLKTIRTHAVAGVKSAPASLYAEPPVTLQA
jgi:hypothetical protein